jgi:hypothetical protein
MRRRRSSSTRSTHLEHLRCAAVPSCASISRRQPPQRPSSACGRPTSSSTRPPIGGEQRADMREPLGVAEAPRA